MTASTPPNAAPNAASDAAPNAAPDAAPNAAPTGDPYIRPDPAPDGALALRDGALALPDASPGGAFGSLRVRVACARGALPVCGAHVFVLPCGGGGVCAACETDDSGMTRLFTLPTESVAGSKIGEAPPCARYDIEVLAEGFEPATFVSVPVYEGVTSSQYAELIPRAAGGVLRAGTEWERRRGGTG